MKVEAGDKVRLKATSHAGSRGVVEAIRKGELQIRLKDTGQRILVPPEGVTNLSLAARRAWVSMPNRHVGRPKGMRFCDRVSVTLRIDRDLWAEFQMKESTGVIDDRTATINNWLREKLAELEQTERQG